MNAAESRGLKKGSRVYWRGDATDGGIITEMSWDAVTITWDNGQVATVHHGDMREIQRAPAMPTAQQCLLLCRYIVSGRRSASGTKLTWPPVGKCPLLAHSGHRLVRCTCPLSGVKRTSFRKKRTSKNVTQSGHRLPLHRPDRLLSSRGAAGRMTPPIFTAALFTRVH
jgi:hypothetical protein